jgi:hypothetical protein
MPKVKQRVLSDILPDYILDLNFIVFMEFGSTLYGTDTPESDIDFKGIYLPTREQILLNKIPKSVSYKTKTDKKDQKNSKDDIDCQVFSLHYFLELAAKGETAAIDMLHASDDWPIYSSDLWVDIRKRRQMFYSKNLKAFVSYARKQAAKYGLKGTRIDAAQKVVDFMKAEIFAVNEHRGLGEEVTLADVWEDLPQGEHIHKLEPVLLNGLRMYQVCGKKFQETAKLSYVVPIMLNFLEQYGHRAKLAQENKGVDWKAMSHATRAAFQVLSLFTTGDITFPLPQANYLRAVKEGKYDFTTKVLPLLEAYMKMCEHASESTDLPEEVDREQIDKLLIEIVGGCFEKSKETDVL